MDDAPVMRIVVVLVLAALVGGCTGGSASQVPDSAPAPTAGSSVAESATASPASTSPLVDPAGSGATGSGIASPAASIVVPASTPGQTFSTPTRAPRPTATLRPTVAPLQVVALRYLLVGQFGRPIFCDPDFYPVARSDEAELASQRLPAIRDDRSTYLAITARLGMDSSTAATPSSDQVLAIYREWKMLAALVLEPSGDGYRFDHVAAATSDGTAGWHVVGTIDAAGTVTIERRDPSGPPPCPICLSRGTLIATPNGPVAVEEIRTGLTVWTADASGLRVVGWVVLAGSTPVPPTHRVVDLRLADGRTVRASAGHPLPDGRPLGVLRRGDLVDGARVASATLVPYAGGATFDLLPSGTTGIYWADGIPLASTLGPRP
jgi:hypothetical protein